MDPIEKPIPIQPGQHYSMGGLACDENGQTPIEGLFAVGECSCISVHGANRLGGNSLLETIVFGKRAGEQAANLVESEDRSDSESLLNDALREQKEAIDSLKVRQKGERQITIRRRMQATMTEKVGLFRKEESLKDAVETLAELKDEYKDVIIDNTGDAFNYDVVDTLELGGMLELAEVTALAALRRRECRGGHWRTDHPGRKDGEWLKHSLAFHNPEGPPRIEYEDVLITKYEPTERKY
jgi:succinate dehydrogenase / fumarate reductase flavoprotein subunit